MNQIIILQKQILEQEKLSASWDSNPDPLVSGRVPFTFRPPALLASHCSLAYICIYVTMLELQF